MKDNILSVNLMHDIGNGKFTAAQAREKYSEITLDFMLNRPAPYSEALQFIPPTEDTWFTDETKIGGAMLTQAGEK